MISESCNCYGDGPVNLEDILMNSSQEYLEKSIKEVSLLLYSSTTLQNYGLQTIDSYIDDMLIDLGLYQKVYKAKFNKEYIFKFGDAVDEYFGKRSNRNR